MDRDAALDAFAFIVGLRLMTPEARRQYRIAVRRELGDDAPHGPSLADLEDEHRLLSGEREPVSLYDQWRLDRAERARSAPPFDADFWRLRIADLTAAGWAPEEARAIVVATRERLEHSAHIEGVAA